MDTLTDCSMSYRNTTEFVSRSQPGYVVTNNTPRAALSRIKRPAASTTTPWYQPQPGLYQPHYDYRCDPTPSTTDSFVTQAYFSQQDENGHLRYNQSSGQRGSDQRGSVYQGSDQKGSVYQSSYQQSFYHQSSDQQGSDQQSSYHQSPDQQGYDYRSSDYQSPVHQSSGNPAARLSLPPPSEYSYSGSPTDLGRPRQSVSRRRFLLPEEGGPIPDGRVMDDPLAADAHDLIFSKIATPEFQSVVERKRKENKADGYDPFATFNEWNACAVYERRNKESLPQYKVRKLADGTRGILKHAVENMAPEYLQCLPDNRQDAIGDIPENRKRKSADSGFNYKDPAETKEDDFVTKAWDTVKWNVMKRPIMVMRGEEAKVNHVELCAA